MASSEAYHIPTPGDVYETRRYLLESVPAELANKIIDDAQYWPKVSCSAKANSGTWTVTEGRGQYCCLLTPRFSDLILEKSFKIKEVRFRITSHDQGWCDQNSFPTKYQGSWTWFEAAIVRGFKTDTEDEEEGPSSPIDIKSRIERALNSRQAGPDAEALTVKNVEKDSDVWHIQRNLRASRTLAVHEVVWTDNDPDGEIDEREFTDMTGAGRGKGFIRSLEPRDRIAVIGRAMYGGWTNYVAGVEIEIFYSV